MPGELSEALRPASEACGLIGGGGIRASPPFRGPFDVAVAVGGVFWSSVSVMLSCEEECVEASFAAAKHHENKSFRIA